MSLNFYLYCVYRVYYRPLIGATSELNLVPWVLKKIFSAEMDKNYIYLVVQADKMPIFRKFALKNALIPPMSRISPGLWSGEIWVICFIESPLKWWRMLHQLHLKTLFVFKIFKDFIMTFWSWRKNGLIRKIRLISKLMSQSG